MDERAIEAALRAGRLAPLIERAEQASGVAARRYATDLVARAISLADPGSVRAELRARARALGVEEAAIAASEDAPPPHAVRVPLVDGDDAFVRMLWVEFDPAAGTVERLALDGRARHAIADALARAAELAPPLRARDRFRLVAARPLALEGALIEGDSAAAGALVSAVSLWSERPVRAGLAITGAITGTAIARVGAIGAKVRAALEAGCDAILVPAENALEVREITGIQVIPVASVDALLDAALVLERARIDPDRAAREARATFSEGWRGYRWPSIAERLARTSGALPEGRPDLRIEVLARLAAARRHLGDPEGSLLVIESAQSLATLAADAVPDASLTLLAQQRAMTELKLFRARDAARAAKRALEIARRARLRGEVIKALGCTGLVAIALGALDRAEAAFAEALALTLVHAPADAARSRVYLLDALGRLGRADDARAQWQAAMREVEEGDVRARRTKESWVRTGWGGALAAMQRWSEAIEVLDVAPVHESLHDDPLPGLLARRHLGVALARAGSGATRDRGLHLLATSPLAHGRALEPGLRSLAHVNVLVEAETRIAIGRWDPDAAARTAIALAALPGYGDAPERLGAARAKVAREAARGGEPLRRALATLIARCEAI